MAVLYHSVSCELLGAPCLDDEEEEVGEEGEEEEEEEKRREEEEEERKEGVAVSLQRREMVHSFSVRSWKCG